MLPAEMIVKNISYNEKLKDETSGENILFNLLCSML